MGTSSLSVIAPRADTTPDDPVLNGVAKFADLEQRFGPRDGIPPSGRRSTAKRRAGECEVVLGDPP